VPIRDLVKQTLTPQRLSLTGWALSAILFGSVGLAAIQLDNRPPSFADRFSTAGLPLPPAGPVTSTASIDGQRYQIEIVPGPGQNGSADGTAIDGHIETLRKEIIALRRRVEAIAIQNSQYSRRLSDLETSVFSADAAVLTQGRPNGVDSMGPERQDTYGVSPSPDTSASAATEKPPATGPHPAITSPVPLPKPHRSQIAQIQPIETIPAPEVAVQTGQQDQPEENREGVEAAAAGPEQTDRSAEPGTPIDRKPDGEQALTDQAVGDGTAGNEAAGNETADETVVTFVPDGPAPRLIEGPLPGFPMPDRALPAPIGPKLMEEPVRIVELPTNTDAPLTTGSIDPSAAAAPPADDSGVSAVTASPLPRAARQQTGEDRGAFTASPAEEISLLPPIVRPSGGAGTLRSAATSSLARSDFGAVIGRYASQEDAIMAWIGFAEQNSERMSGLRPMLTPSRMESSGFELLVGPFGNAADAAVACLQLIDVAQTCYPALFAGTPLPSRENAARAALTP